MKVHPIMSPLAGAAALVSTLAAPAAAVALQPAAAAPPSEAANPRGLAPTASETPATTASARLRGLLQASDEASLRRNPLNALYRGDMRYAPQFGDYISDSYFAAERASAEQDLAALARVDRSALGPDEQTFYDAFKWQRTTDLRGLQPDILAATVVRPVDQFNGFHTFIPDAFSGTSVAPFATVADYEANLSRLRGYAAFFDKAIERFRQGLESGVVQPKLVVERVIGQLDEQIAQGVDQSPFYKPVLAFPDAVPERDRERLRAAYAHAVRGGIIPAYTRLRDFLKTDYLPKARDSVGLVGMKGGPALYRYLVELRTTTGMAPERIHEIGLSEVARIKGAEEAIVTETGFKGTLAEFFTFIRTDERFKPKSEEALRQGYFAIAKRVDAAVPRLFSTIPATPLDIRPVPAYIAKSQAGAYYQQGAPDGSRPGVFFFNTYDLPSRTTEGMETLFLHEGTPGHHFQISLAQENASLPAVQRFNFNNAYAEGWALYAESLGPELGLFTDPYQRFGHLDAEMFRALRLVVDTGIHLKGWSRDQAIEYMLANSPMGRTDATAEVERYIAYPGQALSYKIGQLTIKRLRDRAQAALGDRFDLRDFHAQVLMTGSLPMSVLEAKIDSWIAAQKRGGRSSAPAARTGAEARVPSAGTRSGAEGLSAPAPRR